MANAPFTEQDTTQSASSSAADDVQSLVPSPDDTPPKTLTVPPTEATDKKSESSARKKPQQQQFAPDLPKDTLEGRYDILLDSPLTHLDSRHAKAFEAKDSKNPRRLMYALVCNNHFPVRITELLACADFKDQRFLKPEAAGIANLSGAFGCHYVTIQDQPSGQSIAGLMKRGHKFTEKSVIKDLILPMYEVLGQLQERKVLHGRLCTDSIFYNESGTGVTQLAECFTDPIGSGQSFYFEPIDRAQTHPYARGDNDFKADFFALGVVTLHMLLGFNPVAGYSQDEYFEKLMAHGSYNTLVGNREFSGMVDDLLKGLLSDHPDDRWGLPQLQKWLGGKKFNLLRPSLPREAPRPFLYQDVPYFNRKHLSYHLSREWSTSKAEMRDRKLSRWVELSIKRPDLAEKMAGIIQLTGGETGRLATDDDDLITKSLILMDPLGPIRLQHVSLHVSGIGNYYAHAIQEAKTTSLQFFQRILDGDYLSTWMDANEHNYSFTAAETVWHIEKVKAAYRQSSLGFGQERLLYELNPTLPCQSKMIDTACPMSIFDVLMALNRCTPDIRRNHDPVDRHVAAYLLAKMKIYVDVGTRIDQFPAFRKHATLKGLLILSQAQQKIGNPALPELTRWAADRMRPILEGLHSRTLRREIQDEMEKAIPKGQVGLVVRLLNNPEIIQQDEDGYRRAKSRFVNNARKISELNRRGTLNERAESSGAKLSILTGYIILTLTLLRILSQSQLF